MSGRGHLLQGRRRGLLPAAVLFLAGLILIGQGLWIPAKAVLAQILLERAFAETVRTGADAKPWPWADTWPVARVDLPRLRRSVIVLHGSSGQALAFGPGHVEGTAAPGTPGTTVYAAHRDTHFSFLGQAAPGDEIRVTGRDGATLHFRVTHSSVVPWDAFRVETATDGHRLVLATCWPLDAKVPGPLRYLVHAEMLALAPSAMP